VFSLNTTETDKPLYTDNATTCYINPSTNTIGATTFIGNLTGTATRINISTVITNANYPFVFAESPFAGSRALGMDSNTTNLYINPATNTIGADNVVVADEAYGAGWNGSNEVPTKNAVYDKIEASIDRPYGSYSAVLSQSGTSAPTVLQVNENTLGGTVVWTRSTTGIYIGTLSGAFPTDNKTMRFVGGARASVTDIVVAGWNNGNSISLLTYGSTGTAKDGVLGQTHLKVEVYP
jgi:hypothetical protein